MLRALFSGVTVAAAIFGGAANAASTTADEAKAGVTRFFEAIERSDRSAYSQVAPRVYLIAAPNFGVPLSFEEARQAFAACRLQQIQKAEALDEEPGAFQVVVSLACPSDRHISPTVGVLTDGKFVVAVYPGGFPSP